MLTKFSLTHVQRVLRVGAALLAIAVTLGLLVGGAQPVAVGLFTPPWDKLVHAGVFALLAGAMGYASGLRGARMVVAGFCAAMAVGFADEWHQIYLPGRSADLADLAADAIGAALGASSLLARARVETWVAEHVASLRRH